MKPNKTCVICNKEYSYCPSCKNYMTLPSWMNLFDNENCKNIYEICVNYRDKKIDIKTAKELLSKCDINSIEIENGTNVFVIEIMSYNEEIKETKETKITESINNDVCIIKEENTDVKEDKKYNVNKENKSVVKNDGFKMKPRYDKK